MNKKIERMLGLRGYSPIYFKTEDDIGGGSSGSEEQAQEEGSTENKDDKSETKAETQETEKPEQKTDAEKAELLKEVMKKKDKITNLSGEVSTLKEQLKAFDGIDLDSVKQMIKEKEEQENKALEAKGEFDRVKQNMNEAHQAELNTLKAQIEELTGKLNGSQSTINDLTVGSAFEGSELINKELTLTPSKARIIYGDNFDIVDGKIVGYDKPRGKSDRTQLVDSSGNPLAFGEAIKKLVNADPDVDSLLLSKMKAGSGSKPDTSSLKQPVTKQVRKGVERIANALGVS